MQFEDVFSIWELPPMRPVKKGEDIVLVYPFYMYKSNNVTRNKVYRITTNISRDTITIKVIDTKNMFNIAVETPDILLASTLRGLYNLAIDKSSNEKSIPGILSCRDPILTSSGFPMRGQLVAIFFEGEPIRDPFIYLIVGTANLIEGSCQRTSSMTYKRFDISILYVRGTQPDIDEVCPIKFNTPSGDKQSRGIKIYVENIGTNKLILESDSLYCYPVYPPSKAKSNKFYPATVTAIISPSEHIGIGYGAVFELLAGTIFASPGGASGPGMDLISGNWIGYYQSHFIPSPALLSVTHTGRWHDQSLTIRAQDVPLLRLKFDIAKAKDIIEQQIIESLGPVSPLSSKIFKISKQYAAGLYNITIDKEIIEKVIENLKNLKLSGGAWNDLIEGLKILRDSVGDIELFRYAGPRVRESRDIHVDPKLVAKALLNELVSFPIIYQSTNSNIVDVDKVFSRVTAIRYRRIATITDALAYFLTGSSIVNNTILYVHAWINFIPARILAAMYWALSRIAGSLRNNRVLRDTSLVLLSWALMATAYTWKYFGRDQGAGESSPWSPILLHRLAESIGVFAILLGVHGLTHIASQAIADALGVSRPDLYIRELTRLYISDTRLLMMHGQRGMPALLINGALLISPSSNLLADLNVAVAQEGLYHVVRGYNIKVNSINNVSALCQELYRATGSYTGGTCMNVWRLSIRSYIAAISAAPPQLRDVADFILEPFDLEGYDMSEVYYPSPEIIVYLIEKQAKGEGISSTDIKAYASQLAKAKLPLCYDGCEMCVMSDECPLISSPVQQYMVSRSSAHLLCHVLGSLKDINSKE